MTLAHKPQWSFTNEFVGLPEPDYSAKLPIDVMEGRWRGRVSTIDLNPTP